jgi:hypothetical protein
MNRQPHFHGDGFLEANTSLSGEHVPMEMDSWKVTHHEIRFRGYMSDQQTFPCTDMLYMRRTELS